MSLRETIERAADVAGSQKNLAALIGEKDSHISAFKNGTRYCGYKKRAAIAAIAGENVARAMLEAIAEDLSEDVPYELEAKLAFEAILTAFPPETDAPTKNGPKKGPSKRTGGNGGIRTLDEALHPILP